MVLFFSEIFGGGGPGLLWGFINPWPPSFIAFLIDNFGLWGFIRPKIFRKFSKFSKNFPWWNPTQPKMAKFCKILPFLAKKGRFLAQKPKFFLNFGAFGAEIAFFSAAFGGRSVESGPPPWGRAPPKNISDFFITALNFLVPPYAIDIMAFFTDQNHTHDPSRLPRSIFLLVYNEFCSAGQSIIGLNLVISAARISFFVSYFCYQKQGKYLVSILKVGR